MHHMTINNFGPIINAEIDLTRLLLFIGPQASGKSTLAKLIFFFLHVRDEVTAFIIESAESRNVKDANYRLKKRLTNRFVEFWGPMPQSKDVHITYHYSDDRILEITLDKQHHKFITPKFSHPMWKRIKSLIYDTQSRLKSETKGPIFPSSVGKLASEQERTTILEHIRSECNKLFSYDKELFFIPAGRSLLSTLSEQIQYIHPHMLDYPMRQFVDTVNTTEVFFDRSLDDIILAKRALSATKPWTSAIRRAQSYARKILKGEYRHDREGGKLYIEPSIFTKINYASSGQQEALWILLTLFLIVLEKSRTLVVIEEPEAHLFSNAQKDIIEFIAFVFNVIGCDFLITTHSPYVLSCLNNLMYGEELSKKATVEAVAKVIPKELWLKSSDVSGFWVDRGTTSPLLESGMPVLKCELLDSASDLINEEYENLISLEREFAKHEG